MSEAALVQEGRREALPGGGDHLGFGHSGFRGVLGPLCHSPVPGIEWVHLQAGVLLNAAHFTQA